MKLVNRTTFLQFPPGTLYSLYSPAVLSETRVKEDSIFHLTGSNDFYVSDVFEDAVDVDSVYSSGSGEVDVETWSRDAMFDMTQLFVIWEPADIQAVIGKLQKCAEAVAPMTAKLIPVYGPGGRRFVLNDAPRYPGDTLEEDLNYGFNKPAV